VDLDLLVTGDPYRIRRRSVGRDVDHGPQGQVAHILLVKDVMGVTGGTLYLGAHRCRPTADEGLGNLDNPIQDDCVGGHHDIRAVPARATTAVTDVEAEGNVLRRLPADIRAVPDVDGVQVLGHATTTPVTLIG
jgi:hypothetical protein